MPTLRMVSGWGQRLDGTPKGPGFASVFLPGGDIMSEWSAGTPDFVYPTIYEGITPWELDALRINAMYAVRPGYQRPPADAYTEGIFDRAYQQAMIRVAQGRSPFWESYEKDGPPGAPWCPFHYEYR